MLAALASLTLLAYFVKFCRYLRALEAFGFLITMLADIARAPGKAYSPREDVLKSARLLTSKKKPFHSLSE